MTLQVSTDEHPDATVVALTGDLDIATSTRLRRELEQHAGRNLVLDLSGLRFCDSTGLGLLVALHKHCRAEGHELLLANPQPAVRAVLDMTRLITLLPTYATIAGARSHDPAELLE